MNDLLPSELAWGLLGRGLSLIYVIALTSLRLEILALCGSRGISPVGQRLRHLRTELGPGRAVLRHPSLLWISSSDRALAWLPVAGIVSACFAMAGIASPWMLALTWVIYLSFDVAVGLTFPWESMLFEAGLLAVLLPPLATLPDLRITEPPAPILLLAFLWLLFRVLFGFGKNKFTTAAASDPVYLRAFLISQPMPSPLAWRAFRLPRRLLIASLALLFIVEMVLPFFVFVPGWPRLVAAAAFGGLMVSIQLMGNFGFFNMLVVVLSLALLDGRSIAWPWQHSVTSVRDAATIGFVSWTLLAGLLHLPFNTFVARGWPEWPAWAALPRGLRGAVGVLRALMPFRTVHAYGVFPPRIGPPVKWLPVIEGTRDGINWATFEYRYMPCKESSPPRFVAPHAPRIDHFALYEGCSVGCGNYLGTIFSQGDPYCFSTVGSLDRMLQRLMEPGGPVRRFFAVDPFDGAPPIRMRIRTYAFSPTTPSEQASTGRYWHKDFVHEHAPERGADPSIWQRWLPSSEQLHPDERWARRRVPRLEPLLSARDLEVVKAVLPPETTRMWETFWHALMPQARDARASGWPAIDRLARDLRASIPADDLDCCDRIRGAVSTALLERIEPHVLGLATPAIETLTYFHASLLVHAAMLEGPDRVAAILHDPLQVQSQPGGYEEAGLMLITLLRHAMMLEHARSFRMMSTMNMEPPPESKAVPGFMHVQPLLAQALPDGGQQLPRLDCTADGEWRIDQVAFIDRRLHSRAAR